MSRTTFTSPINLFSKRSFFSNTGVTSVQLASEPYFYGMPLPNLVIKNGQTTWEAPYDRDYGHHPSARNYRFPLSMRQIIELEPSNDPLLYSLQPATLTSRTSSEIEWSNQLCLFTRTNELNAMGADKYEYEMRIAVRSGFPYEPFEAYPYVGINASTSVSLDHNPGEFKWLTYLPVERYPGLIRTAQDVSKLVPHPDNHYELALALRNYLAIEGGFTYTLNFSQIRWDPSLDHIEDFVVNTKHGHCEFFASALVLMLDAGIPARLIAGYHGGDFDGTTNSYAVLQRHAHAWVEAYIRPQDCPREWTRTGEERRLGSWLRLDPTPGSGEDASMPDRGSALSAAKDFWSNYVMGLDSQKQRESLIVSLIANPFRGWGEYFTLAYWDAQWQLFTDPKTWYQSMIFKLLTVFAAILLLAFLHQWWDRRRLAQGKDTRSIKPHLQKWLGKAIGFVAPRWGRWVAGQSPSGKEVPFYQRFQRLLQRYGLARQPHQTARELGQLAVANFASVQPHSDFASHIESIVNGYYRVRYRADSLTERELNSIESSLGFLEAKLKATQRDSLSLT